MRHIVVATDQNFVVPTATTLRSLSLQERHPVTVWILATNVSHSSKCAVEASLAGNQVQLQWVDMQDVDLGDTSGSKLGPASFSRLAIGEVLPTDVGRVLYMDVDMLVMDSLAPLWEHSDQGMVAWAVRSVNYPSICTYGAMDHWPNLGLDPRAHYFNSGLLMIDLHAWRELGIGQRALAHLASPHANGALADQEALNVALHGRWGELDPRWNQQTPLLDHNRGAPLLYSDEILRQARDQPAVIHFLDRPKPWQKGCTHPARHEWLKVAESTAFAPISVESPSMIKEVRWRIRRAASAIVKGR